jgi:tight adherence protein C
MAILLAAVGSAATVVAAAMPWLQPDTLGRRIRAVSSERERIRARERERLASSQAKATLRSKPTGVLKQIVESLNLPVGSAPRRRRRSWRWRVTADLSQSICS